jgi:hypothetical protein
MKAAELPSKAAHDRRDLRAPIHGEADAGRDEATRGRVMPDERTNRTVAPRPCPVCGVVIDAHDLYWAVQRLRSRETEATIRPEDTLRAAGIDGARQATYQRRFSTLLAGRAKEGA